MKSFPRWLVPILVVLLIGIGMVFIQKTGVQSSIIARGQILLDPSLIDEAQGIQTLFITLYENDAEGMMPYGGIKYQVSRIEEKVLDFTLTKDNLQVMNPGVPFPKILRIKARLDRAGQAGPDKPGDFVGEQRDVPLGAEQVSIQINKKIL